MSNFVIIPARNEEKKIAEVISRAKNFAGRIIVVDDGSKDGTSREAEKLGVTVLRHKVNLGKGAALKTGCDYALSQGAERMIVMDADGQHRPEDIPKFLSALQDHQIVFGARQMPKSMPLVLRLGNGVINQILKILYRLKIEDSQCGFRAFTAETYRRIRWEAQDYYVETEMLIKAGKNRLKHATIPIETIYADNYKGTTVLDGVVIVMKMIGWRLIK